MMDETETPLETIELPYGRQVALKAVAYESGLRLLRMTFRENRRFTVIDIDPETAGNFAEILAGWSQEN